MWGDPQMCKQRQEFSPRLVASLKQSRRSHTPLQACGYEAWGYKSSSLKRVETRVDLLSLKAF